MEIYRTQIKNSKRELNAGIQQHDTSSFKPEQLRNHLLQLGHNLDICVFQLTQKREKNPELKIYSRF